VVAAVQLTRQKQKARPGQQGYKKWEPQVSTFASRSIRWGGAYLLLWLVFHVLHFTARAIFPGYSETDVYGNVVKGFSNPVVVAGYVVAMGFSRCTCTTARGARSARSGLSRPSARPTSRRSRRLRPLVALGFVVVPIAVLVGVVKPTPPELGRAGGARGSGARHAARRVGAWRGGKGGRRWRR
jgi:succinate dehydrogenase / fumarate reductase cytochrome b subunit